MSGGLRGPFVDWNARLLVTDDQCPASHLPAFHQAIFHVRILPGKGFGARWTLALENKKSGVRWVGQGARENQLAAGMRFAREMQMLVAKRGTASDEIVNGLIKECVVRHFDLRPEIENVLKPAQNSTALTWTKANLRLWMAQEGRDHLP